MREIDVHMKIQGKVPQRWYIRPQEWILYKGKRKITVRSTRSMVTSMNNVSARTSTSKNTHTITISVTNIRSDGINKTFTNKKKSKRKVKEK